MDKHKPDYEAVWAAAYGAAFVDRFRRSYDILAGDSRLLAGRPLFETAIAGNAETAMTVADEAVEQLRDWIAEEEQ